MTTNHTGPSNAVLARTAGLLYLIVVITGFFSIAYVPSKLIVREDAAATVANILASESMFRLGIVAGFACYVTFLVLPLVLHRLLAGAHRVAGALMVTFALASVPISFLNLRNKLDVLSLLGGGDHLKAFTAEQLQTQVMLSLDAYRNGILVSEVFWGLWLLPFGYLVFRSGLLPRILGVLLMLGCFGYLIDVVGEVMSPAYRQTVLAQYVSLPSALGEIGTCLWLLVMGARESSRARDGRTAAPGA